MFKVNSHIYLSFDLTKFRISCLGCQLTWAVERDGTWRFIPGFSTLVHVCDLVENNVDFDSKSSRVNSSKD